MIEFRTTEKQTVEFRSGPKGPMAAGYAAVFNSYSRNLGGFIERVHPGAFNKTIQEQDVRALFNHDPNQLLGRMGAGTLRLITDERGLRYEVDLPDTSVGRDLRALISRGDIQGSSFSFEVVGRGQSWTRTPQGFPLRELRALKLRDVGPVVFPAYSKADVALRSLAEERSMEFEEVLHLATSNQLATIIEDSETPREERQAESHRVHRRVYL